MMEQVNIDGIGYVVVKRTPFEFNGKHREQIALKRPNGKKFYFATRYENGAISRVVRV